MGNPSAATLVLRAEKPSDTPEVLMDKTKLPLVPVLLAAFCAAAAGYAGTVEGAQAACAASMPSVRASPAEGAPGEPFRLQGEGFYGDFICDDTGPRSLPGLKAAVPRTASASSSSRAKRREPWRP